MQEEKIRELETRIEILEKQIMNCYTKHDVKDITKHITQCYYEKTRDRFGVDSIPSFS